MSDRYTICWLGPDPKIRDTKEDRDLSNDEIADLLNSTTWTRVEDGLPKRGEWVRLSFDLASDFPGAVDRAEFITNAKLTAHGWTTNEPDNPEYPQDFLDEMNAGNVRWQPTRGPK